MLKKHLTIKLFLVLLITVSIVVIAMLMMSRWSFQRGFTDYLNQLDEAQLAPVVERLEQHYNERGSWDSIHPRLWRRLIEGNDNQSDEPPPREFGGFRPERDHGPGGRPPPRDRDGFRPPPEFDDSRRGGFPPPPPRHDPSRAPSREPWDIAPRLNLFDSEEQRIMGRSPNPEKLILHPLQQDDVTIGWLGLEPLKTPQAARDIAFIKSQDKTLYIIALLTLIIAAISSVILARRLLTPIKALGKGATTLAQGDYTIRVDEHSEDELGQLARDFNALAATLAANETARRRWIADISHELRTPLAVLRGEIEAIQDGIRPSNPQTLQSLHSEVIQLNKLVDDLYQLSLSDLGALDYHKEQIDISDVLEQQVANHQARFAAANLTLDIKGCDEENTLFADHKRMTQLFDNLLENSLRYTDAGGRTQISCRKTYDHLIIDIEDSSPGVSSRALPQLFERLYREEASRNRAKGGAGLGLAIVHNIVEAHQGNINAQHSKLGGLHLTLTFPLNTTE
ncbi:ATP-binding protein [Pseudomonadota bacterium]